MSANCSLSPAKPNCKFHKKTRLRTSRAHSASSKSMLSSMTMSTTIKEIDFEVSHSWDNHDDDEDDWDTAGEGGRLPKKRSLPSAAAARPKARHRSVGTTMAPAAEELVVVGKGGRVRRAKVRHCCGMRIHSRSGSGVGGLPSVIGHAARFFPKPLRSSMSQGR